jgi:ATP adenylyltransferase
MTFKELFRFIRDGMRMSHVYQPVMIRTLLKGGGSASVEEIAKDLLIEDRSQIEYYVQIANNMVGKVLRNRGVVQREGSSYRLVGAERWTTKQRALLRDACDKRLAEYVSARGEQIWQHRRKSAGYVSGTKRYDVLKEAKFRCTLCGVGADVRALEVDHIVPRNKGGTDERSNLQALCYKCNAEKRDTDATDFRTIGTIYQSRERDCVFCCMKPSAWRLRNELAIAIEDSYPVTQLHHLILPKRHVASVFDLVPAEMNAMWQLVAQCRWTVMDKDHTVAGFNIGFNSGTTAGQTVDHCHVHVIPRRSGDVADPTGGVRNVIPGKGPY